MFCGAGVSLRIGLLCSVLGELLQTDSRLTDVFPLTLAGCVQRRMRGQLTAFRSAKCCLPDLVLDEAFSSVAVCQRSSHPGNVTVGCSTGESDRSFRMLPRASCCSVHMVSNTYHVILSAFAVACWFTLGQLCIKCLTSIQVRAVCPLDIQSYSHLFQRKT